MIEPTKVFTPELLVPAGSFDRFETGLLYGADAFYLGGKSMNLRAASAGFDWPELKQALTLAHETNRKIYFCLNAFPKDSQLSVMNDYLQQLADYEIDGLIIADPGVVRLAQTHLPNVSIHLSTQANTMNSETVKFWRDQEVSRINLARELSQEDIGGIRKTCPNIELEVFVQGAMCMALSGRCLLSSYMNNRSANLGACAHPCRFDYRSVELVLEEKSREGHPVWALSQDEEYSTIFGTNDLCLIDYLEWFVKAKINALKIEGRTKSTSYLAVVVDVYKTALLDIAQNNFRPTLYWEELKQLGGRHLDSGFFLPERQSFIADITPTKPICAQVLSQETDDKFKLQIKSKWNTSKNIELILPGLKRPVVIPKEYSVENGFGEPLSEVNPSKDVYLRTDSTVLKPGMFIRLAY